MNICWIGRTLHALREKYKKTELEVQPVKYFLIRGYDEFHDGDEWIGIYDSLPKLKRAYEEAVWKLKNEQMKLGDRDNWTAIHEKVMIHTFNQATEKWRYDIPYEILFPKKEESEYEEYKTVQYIVDHPDMFVFKQQGIRCGKYGDYVYDSRILKRNRPMDEVIPVKFRVKHTYEIFEEMGVWWGGWNDCPDWRTMRDKAQEWYVKYNAELKEISHDTLVFACRKLSKEEVDALWDDICRFAPDSSGIADEEVIKKRLWLNREFVLWWD